MNAAVLLSGNEAVARAALAAGVVLGTGYPGTPSTEILEQFSELGGRAQWAPNEKVALEVGMGATYAHGRALVTMKHVGVNVAADPLFTIAYSGISGALVLVSADDPGAASSQNEQDNRRYAVAAGVPMLEPADSQEAYDFTLAAFEISEHWQIPVMLRMTTRVCHCKSIVRPERRIASPPLPAFERDIPGRVMIPAHARPAHRRLRAKLAEIAEWNEAATWDDAGAHAGADAAKSFSAAGPKPVLLNRVFSGSGELRIMTSNVTSLHVREAISADGVDAARVLKLGMTYPLPIVRLKRFAEGVGRCLVIEEGDPYLLEQMRTAGIRVDGKPEMYRFGELNVGRVRRILVGDLSPEPAPPAGKPPALCPGCPHRVVFETLRRLDCIVSGDIGCYTLGALPPFEAMDSQTCMGASIGVGLGLRHTLPPEHATRVVSVIGDSTFVHSGITGLVEMVYNPPPTGHVVLILDNITTAMTGLQEHPGTGRRLDHQPSGRVCFEELVRALGIPHVHVVDPTTDREAFAALLQRSLASRELTVIIARRPCLLVAARIREYERAAQTAPASECDPQGGAPSEQDTGAYPGEAGLDRLNEIPSGGVTNITISGLGGQGVIKASDVLADAAFRTGLDVKKSELHGMSQRGGSVFSDVRIGREVLSPMIPGGVADYLVVIAADQVELNRPRLRPEGRLITPHDMPDATLPSKKVLNMALLGVLSRHLGIPPACWTAAIRACLPEKHWDTNLKAFSLGHGAGPDA